MRYAIIDVLQPFCFAALSPFARLLLFIFDAKIRLCRYAYVASADTLRELEPALPFFRDAMIKHAFAAPFNLSRQIFAILPRRRQATPQHNNVAATPHILVCH